MAAFWGRLCAGWFIVSVVGWAGYYVAGGGGDNGHAAGERAASWLLGVPLAIGLALLLIRLAERHGPLPPLLGMVVVATGAWGLSNAVGWTVDVTVGGPATGLTTGCLLVAASHPQLGERKLRLFAIILLGVGAMVVGRLVAGVDALVPRTLLPLVAGIAVAAGAWRVFGVQASFRPVIVIVSAWTFGWLAAFEIARQLPVGLPAAVYAVTELGLASAIGGALTGVVWLSRSGESVIAVAARWALSGVAGTVVGLVVAAVFWALGIVSARVAQVSDLWAAGTTFGLGLAGACALAPTLIKTGRSSTVSASEPAKDR